jgi:polyhydroxyalkanoate synthesis regulator phasin
VQSLRRHEEIDMSKQSEAIVTRTPSSTAPGGGLLAGVRQLAYAGVGLWGVASEDLGHFYQRCVVRGEQIMSSKPPATPTEAEPHPREAAAGQPHAAASRAIRPMSIFNAFGAVESYHIDLNADRRLPTKEELDALSERVEALSREVDALVDQRKQEQTA